MMKSMLTKKKPVNHLNVEPTGHSYFYRDGTANDYGLVQRMEATENFRPNKRGVDARFYLEYMGSSEFESGVVFQSLRNMREIGGITIRPIEYERNGTTHTVFFVGPELLLDQAIASFIDWNSVPVPRTLEAPRFNRALDGEDVRSNGWWALRAGVMWTLDESIAQRMAEGINDHD